MASAAFKSHTMSSSKTQPLYPFECRARTNAFCHGIFVLLSRRSWALLPRAVVVVYLPPSSHRCALSCCVLLVDKSSHMETTPPWESRKRVHRESPERVFWQSSQNTRFLATVMQGVGNDIHFYWHTITFVTPQNLQLRHPKPSQPLRWQGLFLRPQAHQSEHDLLRYHTPQERLLCSLLSHHRIRKEPAVLVDLLPIVRTA